MKLISIWNVLIRKVENKVECYKQQIGKLKFKFWYTKKLCSSDSCNIYVLRLVSCSFYRVELLTTLGGVTLWIQRLIYNE